MPRKVQPTPSPPVWKSPSESPTCGDYIELVGRKKWCKNTRKHYPHYHETKYGEKYLCMGTANSCTYVVDEIDEKTGEWTLRAILR